MANSELAALLAKGVDAWNRWREESLRYTGIDSRRVLPELSQFAREPDLSNWDCEIIRKFDMLRFVSEVMPERTEASETYSDFLNGRLSKEQERSGWATLNNANLSQADITCANLSELKLQDANLNAANLSRANLYLSDLSGSSLMSANLTEANLERADLSDVNLTRTNLAGANLKHANLQGAILVETILSKADMSGCHVYGVSAWNLEINEDTKQQDLIITASGEPEVSVDNIQVAQFVYLLLRNENIRDVIDTVGRRGVLLLGRFTEGRIAVLMRLREEHRRRGYVPIVFNFDKPQTKDFTETVRLLASLSKFVIADITNPKSSPLELQATVPEVMVPFQPIIERGQKPFAMLQDLWIKHDKWVFEPIEYRSVDSLIANLDQKIIKPAEARFEKLVKRRAKPMRVRRI
jgi:uncharacterized protein YjbI with pentapeptide repeats